MIVFSGLDGSGKSTQINRLKIYLENEGLEVEQFWSRGGYTPGMEWVKSKLRKSNASVIPSNRGNSKERDKAFKNKLIRKLWLSLAIFDLILHYAIILRIKNRKKLIICDRYIFDTQLDFELNFPDENVSSWLLWKLLKRIALRPGYHFVLTISVEESQKRSLLKDEPFPDSQKVLSHRLASYLKYAQSNKYCHLIKCEKSIEKVEKEIQSYINQ